jgi:hypothetical protein
MNIISDITLNISFWGIKKLYNIGYWSVWGTPKNGVEILLEKQNKKIEIMHQELVSIRKKLNEIGGSNYLCYDSKKHEKINDYKQNNSIITEIVNEIEKENLLVLLQEYVIINSTTPCKIIDSNT